LLFFFFSFLFLLQTYTVSQLIWLQLVSAANLSLI
jgi:hypothetical protein